jgi:hypothetical protein
MKIERFEEIEAIRGFINYLKKHEKRKVANREL